MADTTFVDGSTTVVASWLNDVNDATYTTVPAHSATLASGVVLKDSSTGGAQIPSGTTAQRPGAPVGTLLRYNTTISNWEGYNGSVWGLLASGFAASGANVDITSLGNNTSTIYTTAGTSTAYTITPNPAITAYAIGQSFVVNFNAASGTSPTLQISGIVTPPNLVRENYDGTFSNISANEIPINHRSRITLISTTQALVEKLPTVPFLSSAINTTSGTSVDITSIPSWVNRVTVIFNNVSTNGSSGLLLQLGSGSPQTSGYQTVGTASAGTNSVLSGASTSGFYIFYANATDYIHGTYVLTRISGNTWVGVLNGNRAGYSIGGGGNVSLSGAIDRVRLTTTTGADMFDTGSMAVLYE